MQFFSYFEFKLDIDPPTSRVYTRIYYIHCVCTFTVFTIFIFVYLPMFECFIFLKFIIIQSI